MKSGTTRVQASRETLAPDGRLAEIDWLRPGAVVLVPVFRYLSGTEGRRLLARAGEWCQAPGMPTPGFLESSVGDTWRPGRSLPWPAGRGWW
jgi:hypothetical protein